MTFDRTAYQRAYMRRWRQETAAERQAALAWYRRRLDLYWQLAEIRRAVRRRRARPSR